MNFEALEIVNKNSKKVREEVERKKLKNITESESDVNE